MVEKKTFQLWSNEVDFQKRGDVQYWSPIYLENSTFVEKFDILSNLVGLKGGATPLGSNYVSDGIPFLRIQNIGQNKLNLDDVVYISENTHNTTLFRSQLNSGDVLFTITGRIGSVAVVPEDLEKANINQHMVRMRIKDKNRVLPYYLSTYLLTKYARLQHERVAYGTTRIALDYPTLNSLRVYLPDLTTQKKVEKTVLESFKLEQEASQEYDKAKEILAKELEKIIPKEKSKGIFVRWNDEIDLVERIDPMYYFENEYEKNDQEYICIREEAEVFTGKTPPYDDYAETGDRILKFRAIRGNGLDWKNEERGYVKTEVSSKYKKQLEQQDIVLGCSAHQASYIGSKIDIVDYIPDEFDKVLTVAEIMTIRSKGNINPYVLLLFLRSKIGYDLIQRQVKGQTSHLYPKDVNNIKIPKQLLKLSQSAIGKKIGQLVETSLNKKRRAEEVLKETVEGVEKIIEIL